MRFQVKCAFVVLVGTVLPAGCGMDNAWTASRDKSYSDPIQRLVEAKITEQSSAKSGPERWESYKSDEYQGPDDIGRDRKRLELELTRHKAARELLAAGALSLTDCLAFSLEFNDQLQASRAAVRAMGGEKLIAKSRFLPRLTFDLSKGTDFANGLAMGISGIQTLLEFGKDNPIDVALRELQRQALFGYEEDVANVLSDVRLRFFTVLLRQEQLKVREQLREQFIARYERMRKLAQARRVPEVDVLTAKLNVLNEQMRINSLEKEILRQKMDLLHAIGFPLSTTGFQLKGAPEKFDIAMNELVDIAFRRSTRIAQARAAVFERDRVVRQIIWEYLPRVNVVASYRGSHAAGGAALAGSNNVYGAGPFGESRFKRGNGGAFVTDPDWLSFTRSGWNWGAELELPIFTGLERTGKFRREKALLVRDRHRLCDVISLTELEVRRTYQTVLERERERDILQETVRISKERLRVQERLKELGKIGDNELETFRGRFFADQDGYFEKQIQLIGAQERLRLAMRYFEPVRPKGD